MLSFIAMLPVSILVPVMLLSVAFMSAFAPVSLRCPQAATASIDENSNKALNFMISLLRPLQQPSARHVPRKKGGPSVAAHRFAGRKAFEEDRRP